jgi:hypothetical protein
VLARLAAIAVFLALPVVGCGSSQKDAYRQDFQTDAAQFKKSLSRAATKVSRNATLPARAAAIREVRAAVDKLAADLGQLDPPDNLKATHDDAVRQLRTLSSDLADYGAAAAGNDASAAAKAVPKVQADQTVLQKTLDQLDSQAGS